MAKTITLRNDHSSVVVDFDLAECTNCEFEIPGEFNNDCTTCFDDNPDLIERLPCEGDCDLIQQYIAARFNENSECLIPTCGMVVHSHEEDFIPAGLTAFGTECGQGAKTVHLLEIIAGTGAPITTADEYEGYLFVPTEYARGVLDALDTLSVPYVLGGSSMDLLFAGEMDAAVAAAYAEPARTCEKGTRDGAVTFKPSERFPLGLLVQQLGAHGVDVKEEYEPDGTVLLVAENDAALATRVILDLGGTIITAN